MLFRPHILVFALVMLFSLAVRLSNLNYNSPFMDEAVNIVVGRLGIFQGDWWTYNSSAWLPGLPYIYPTIAALTSVTGGVLGSRLLNVLFGLLTLECIYVLTARLSRYEHPYDYFAGIIAVVVAGGSAVAIYISRIATYDAPCYFFFFLSLIFLVRAEDNRSNTGRLYFYSAMLLLLASLTKIIIFIYLPVILIYSYYQAQNAADKKVHFWLIYFLLPLLLISALYGIGNFTMLSTFAQVNQQTDATALGDFLLTIWRDSSLVWIFWTAASIALLFNRRWKLWVVLTFGAIWITIPHFISLRRLWSFEKQLTITINFLSSIIGIGLVGMVRNLPWASVRFFLISFMIIFFAHYWLTSYLDSQRFNRMWNNSNDALKYLETVVRPGDKILAESHGSAILALYDKNFPTNTVTFDWFVYRKKTGNKAYVDAIKDGYFDLIELEGLGQQDTLSSNSLHDLIYTNLSGNYTKVYSHNGFTIYKRNF